MLTTPVPVTKAITVIVSHFGDERFAWFQSTDSKSRINFLELLLAGKHDYVLNSQALDYMKAQKLPKVQIERLAALRKGVFEDEFKWKACLNSLRFSNRLHIRIATEGALLGSVLQHGAIHSDLVIVSDDTGRLMSCSMPCVGYTQSGL